MIESANIKLLYTSDIHGNALPIIYGTNEEADIGLAKYATIVQQKREMDENIIVIDNGDLIQGTPMMTHYVKEYSTLKNPMIRIMNDLNIDAGIVGNHEFNFGKEILLDTFQQANYPWLSANILDEQSLTPYFGEPYLIKKLPNGVKVAIIGVTTHYIPNWEASEHIKGIQFEDAFTSLKNWVQIIQENEKPDVLIAAYHGGFERDINTGQPTENLTGENQGYEMATEIPGIDVLLTGHQHRALTGKIGDCLIIQPGHNGKMYGEIDIELKQHDNSWFITNKQASLHTLEGVQAAPQILRSLEPLETSTQNWLDKPMGKIEGDMTIKDPFKARVNKHPFIELVHNIQMEASDADISVTALLDDESKGFSPTVTMRDIVANYIYPNTLVVLSLTGKDIKAALEKSAMYFVVDATGNLAVHPNYISPKPQHYNYDMWEGIEYTINVSNPVGERIEQLRYQGKALNMKDCYSVVLNNYRASGGGDFEMFKNKPVLKEIQQDMVEIISNYFTKHNIIQATTTRNFVVRH